MIRIATRLAMKSDHQHFRHGAIVLKGGSIVATGYNKATEHAEVNALKKLDPRKRKGATIISVRVTKGGKLAMAKPCPECEKYIKESGVKSVIWSDALAHLHEERI